MNPTLSMPIRIRKTSRRPIRAYRGFAYSGNTQNPAKLPIEVLRSFAYMAYTQNLPRFLAFPQQSRVVLRICVDPVKGFFKYQYQYVTSILKNSPEWHTQNTQNLKRGPGEFCVFCVWSSGLFFVFRSGMPHQHGQPDGWSMRRVLNYVFGIRAENSRFLPTFVSYIKGLTQPMNLPTECSRVLPDAFVLRVKNSRANASGSC